MEASEDKTTFVPFVPGSRDIVNAVLRKNHIKTLKEYDTDRESMFLYYDPLPDGFEAYQPEYSGIYKRGEPDIKRIIRVTFDEELEKMIEYANKYLEEQELSDEEKEAINKTKAKLEWIRKHEGAKSGYVNDVSQAIRAWTFVDRETMNPESHIALQNGLLNLTTWQLESFAPNLFYTWKVRGQYNPTIRSLNLMPKFRDFMSSAYPEKVIPTILDYMAYCLYPGFPRQKVLLIVGAERVGKGTTARIIEHILADGYGRFSLYKLLIPDNKFPLQGIEGKNVLIDAEMKREYKKQADFDVFNTLFGGDALDLEEKFKAAVKYHSRAKGIMIGNLPLFRTTNPAFLSRLLITITNPSRERAEIADLDKEIWKAEGDKIVAFLLNRLQSLISRGFRFENELTNEQYAKVWEMLSNSVQMFIDDLVIEGNGVETVYAYEEYGYWCKRKGIPPEKEHSFASKMNAIYPRKRIRQDNQLFYVYQSCAIAIGAEMETKKGIVNIDSMPRL